MNVALGFALGLLPLLVALAFLRWARREGRLSSRTLLLLMLGGGIVGALVVLAEHAVIAWTGLSMRADVAGASGALMVTFLFVAPLGEAGKVLVVWPMFAAREIGSRRHGFVCGASAGAGFAAAEALVEMSRAPSDDPMFALRVALALPAHPFFAGLWGYALGGERSGRRRWFSVVWLFSVLSHGLFVHIVFGRGGGLLLAGVPMVVAMALVAWLLAREGAPVSSPASRRFVRSLEPPSLGALRRALVSTERPVMLHWIAIGALVTLGVVIAFVSGAVALGHWIGVDFAMADESDVRASGPMLLLGSAALLAFPSAGYLVARASGTNSVLEPALGAALAIATAVLLLSVTAPVAVLVALAIAPIAFALACSGAWFGVERAI